MASSMVDSSLKFFCPPNIQDMISTRKTDKANGPKNIPTRILKDFKKKPLSDLININFSSGIFPNSMKLAKVLPVYKKGKKT